MTVDVLMRPQFQFSLFMPFQTFKTRSSAKSNKMNETGRDLFGHLVTCPQDLRSGLYMPPLAPVPPFYDCLQNLVQYFKLAV